MKKNKNKQKVIDLDVLEQINLHAAGIDIGAEEIFVAVPKGRYEESVRSFGTLRLRSVQALHRRPTPNSRLAASLSD